MKHRIWSTTCIYMRRENHKIVIVRDVFHNYAYWYTMVSTSEVPKWTRLPFKMPWPINHLYASKDSPFELIGDL